MLILSHLGNALSSIISWVSMNSGANSLLGRVACPEAPWLAFFILEIEQEENELKNGLWTQFMKELADSNKTNLDQAMKVCIIVLIGTKTKSIFNRKLLLH